MLKRDSFRRMGSLPDDTVSGDVSEVLLHFSVCFERSLTGVRLLFRLLSSETQSFLHASVPSLHSPSFHFAMPAFREGQMRPPSSLEICLYIVLG